MNHSRVAGLLVVAGCLGGCGAVAGAPIHPVATVLPAPSPSAIGLAPGLVEQTATEAGFLQVIQSGQALTGTWTYYEYDDTAVGHVSQGTDAVTGVVQGAAIQLTFGSGTADLGTLSADGSVTLQILQTDGTLAPATLTPGTSADYNAAVLPIQGMVNEWSNLIWGTATPKACVLADGAHDVQVFVSSGGGSICAAAQRLGYSIVSTYIPQDVVLCLDEGLAVTVAVSDDTYGTLGPEICTEVNAGTFPTAQAPG